jgi:serum/glucocorticoid-regulated kinase 2
MKRPYNGQSRQEIRENILAKQASVKPYEIPPGWSIEGMDFINKLLQRRPEQRLGFRGIQEVKDHPWI